MTFMWPWTLAGLLAVPLLVRWYLELEHRRAERARELAALGLVPTAAASSGRATTAPARWRRRVVPLLFLVAAALLLVALARPQATVAEPRREGTVILAFDISGSMAAPDLAPTRIAAAQAAARRFVERQPSTVRLAVVAFGESGLVLQRPTTDRAAVLAAVDRLRPRGGTSLARGLQAALGVATGRQVLIEQSPDGSVEAAGADLGYHGSAAVILLSDGENTSDPDPLDAARIASTAGVKVFPIGLGSPAGTVLKIDGFQVATALDPGLLTGIATTTGGRYYAATDARQLADVYDAIDPVWSVAARRTEVTGLVAGLAGLVLLSAAAISLTRHGRVV